MNTEDVVSSLLAGGTLPNLTGSVEEVDGLIGAVQHLQAGLQAMQGGAMPTPGFVVKTADEAGHKVFINIATSDLVPLPQGWTPAAVPERVQRFLAPGTTGAAPLTDPDVEKLLQVPMYTSQPRKDIDHKGDSCTVMDCVISPAMLHLATTSFRPLKLFIAQLALHMAEAAAGTRLDPHHKLPKMKSKGKLAPLEGPSTGGADGTASAASQQQGKDTVSIALPGDIAVGGRAAGLNTAAVIEEAHPLQPTTLTPSIQYIGRPVESVRISVALPVSAARAARAAQHAVCVELTSDGERVGIAVPGCERTTVALPFAVHYTGAKVELVDGSVDNKKKNAKESKEGKSTMLVVTLPYRPIGDVWRETQRGVAAPIEVL